MNYKLFSPEKAVETSAEGSKTEIKSLFMLPTAAGWMSVSFRFCDPPAACLGHADEDGEEES